MDKFQKSVEMILKKDTEEKGIIEGQLVTHSVIDSYGDYFDKTALDKVDKDKTYFLLHMHDWSKEIGTLKVYQDEKGNLKFTAKLDLSTDDNGNAINQDAQKVYSMMKSGANYEMSVGGFLKQREYGKVQTDKGEVDARIIKEIEVVEGSVVLKGAVPDATVETVKGNKNINKNNKGDDNMPKNIEDLEKGMKQNTEDIKKANEDLTGALEKNKELEEKIEKANEELGKMAETLDEVMKKGMPNPETEEKKANVAFEKYLRTGNKEIEGLEKAAIGTGQATVLIPTILSHEILKETKETSNFLMKGKFYTGSGDYIKIPVRNEITGANQIVKEGQGNTQDGTLGYTHIELRAGYRQVRYPITDELVQDSAFDMVGELKEAISEEFGQTLSELTVKGAYNASTEQFIEGFLTNTTVTGAAITTATTKKVTADDLVKLETGMKASYRKGSAYYVSPKLYEEMKLWKDGDGRYLWMNILEGATMKFNGYPVYVEEFLEDIDTGKYPAVFCDFGKGYAYYQKKGFEQELNRKVNERITEYYTRIRIGGGVIRPKAFSVLKVK
ncbi:phage major capsid protein [Leptotrichia massiliensis]|uniref:phage major capsid protein n=1 Tax=Leptotrichia massiliensis TaxID=1852388 RepID=UPI0008DA0BE5|nr:phage major capsid protein [Leptotrichia massiliensis]